MAESKTPPIVARDAPLPPWPELCGILAAYGERQHPLTVRAIADLGELLWPALRGEMAAPDPRPPKAPPKLQEEMRIFREGLLGGFLGGAEAQALRVLGGQLFSMALEGTQGPQEALASKLRGAAEDLRHVAWFLTFCERGLDWRWYESRVVILAADLAPAIETLAGALDLLREHLEGLDEAD